MKWTKESINKKSIAKVASAVDKNPVETKSMGENYSKDPNDFDLRGLYSTKVTYSGLMNPICKYSITKQLQASANKPLFLTGGKYSDGPLDTEIQTDVNKTETVYSNLTAIYDDKIIKCQDDYGDFTVACYSKNKQATKDYIKEVKSKMLTDNQYRGKFLFFSSASGITFRENPEVEWDNVILDENHKKEILLNTASFLTNDKYRKMGLNQRGLILHGPPGTGKTMVVKSLFSSLDEKNITRVYASADSFPYAESMTELFDFLKFAGKSILAFEDMDLISPDRNANQGRKILGSLLNNLDGLRKKEEPLVVIGTTNDLAIMDEALANRPSRFDRKINIGLPKEAEIKKFYKCFTGTDVSDEIIAMSSGFAGAHIKEVVNTAKLLSVDTETEINDNLNTACSIIKNNFFSSSIKEACVNVRKTMTKEAQQMMFLTPQFDDYDFITHLLPFLNMTKKKSEINTEANTLYSLWKGHDGTIKDNKISHQLTSEEVGNMRDKDLVQQIDHNHVALTENGKKVLRSIILATETNTFENIKEADSVDMDNVNSIVRGGAEVGISKTASIKTSSIKIESVKEDRSKSIDKDHFFNSIKDISNEED
jgi:SpoVK/Ycf46/Vps4 family AAA+-type ATPase